MASVEDVGRACIAGQDREFDVMDHGFHSKPINIAHGAGDTVIINGQLSHMLNWRPDDQYFYMIRMHTNRTIDGIDVRINHGGWGGFVGPVASAIAADFGIPISPDTIVNVWQQITGAIDGGNWQSVAQGIVAYVALNAPI